MAKRKNKGLATAQPSGPSHLSSRIERAENGYVVHVCAEGGKEYSSKTFVAPNERAALRISAAHFGSLKGKGKKGKGKKGKAKAVSSKGY